MSKILFFAQILIGAGVLVFLVANLFYISKIGPYSWRHTSFFFSNLEIISWLSLVIIVTLSVLCSIYALIWEKGTFLHLYGVHFTLLLVLFLIVIPFFGATYNVTTRSYKLFFSWHYVPRDSSIATSLTLTPLNLSIFFDSAEESKMEELEKHARDNGEALKEYNQFQKWYYK